ncbi:MAG TPA: histidine kinase dimerization/phospho-acceptor domain-containing protein [Planctomycetota bacterium]|nr:histidine kinase dimerization/phospho-acceptor domain-containing protein [Planctomycetota bacterium]
MTCIGLLHPPGPNREALSTYLKRSGYSLSDSSPQGGHEAECSGWIIHETMLDDAASRGIREVPVLVLGAERDLPELRHRRLAEPYYLHDVLSEVKRLVEAQPTSSHAARTPSVDPSKSDWGGLAKDLGLVLRGLAHALNNPLSAASGWLQLLAAEMGKGNSHAHSLEQARAELERIETLLRAVALIGGRPSAMRAPLPLRSLVQERIHRLALEGLSVPMAVKGDENPVVLGDPMAFGLMLDLLFDSFLDDRSRIRHLLVSLTTQGGQSELLIPEDAGLLPFGLDHRALGLLLRDTRHGRALGIGLCVRLVEDGMGGSVELSSKGGLDSALRVLLPVEGGSASNPPGDEAL